MHILVNTCLQVFLQLCGHGVTNFAGLGLASNVAGTDAGLDDVAHGCLNGLGFDWPIERVLQHHCHGQDSSNRVDNAFSSNVGGRACI